MSEQVDMEVKKDVGALIMTLGVLWVWVCLICNILYGILTLITGGAFLEVLLNMGIYFIMSTFSGVVIVGIGYVIILNAERENNE